MRYAFPEKTRPYRVSGWSGVSHGDGYGPERNAEILAKSCTCTALTLCPEAERLHAALVATSPGDPEAYAVSLAFTRHRAPFVPHLLHLLPQLEARGSTPPAQEAQPI